MRTQLFSHQVGAAGGRFGAFFTGDNARDTSVRRAHSTPDPDAVPHEPTPNTNPDDVPPPTNAPVQEPRQPEPPIKA